jgi:hypothetical protein
MAYGGLLNPPASIAALIKGPYVDDPVPFRAGYDGSRNANTLVSVSATLFDAMPYDR